MALHRAQGACRFQSERDWRRLLQPRPAGDEPSACARRPARRARRRAARGPLRSDRGPRAAAARARCPSRPGSSRPSGRSAPPPRRVSPTSAVSALTIGIARVAGERAAARELVDVERVGTALRFDRRHGCGGNDAGTRLRAGQGRLEIEHALEPAPVGEDRPHGVRREERVEQPRRGALAHGCRPARRRRRRSLPPPGA